MSYDGNETASTDSETQAENPSVDALEQAETADAETDIGDALKRSHIV